MMRQAGTATAVAERESSGDADREPVLVQPLPPRVNLRDMEAIAREARKLYREARAGLIDISTATKLTFILQAIAKLHERSELEARITKLEALSDGRS